MSTTSKLPRFNPPGNLTDLTEQNKAIWSSKFISKWMDDEISGRVADSPESIRRDPLPQFFNGTSTAYDQSQPPIDITWTAFPARVRKFYSETDELRWKIADSSRILQDEYLEWSVLRDGPSLEDSKVLSVVMTCEGPEYWSFLGDAQPESVLPLYKSLNPDVQDNIMESDLFLTNSQNPEKKVYDPRNQWNFTATTGTIAHLIHPSNTLSAEIDIAAQATVIRQKENVIIEDPTRLITCSQYGNLYRNSDPFIGSAINELARNGNKISIADHVALYIRKFDESAFRLNQHGAGGDPKHLVPLPANTIKYERGSEGAGLRLRIQVPPGTVGTGPMQGKQLTVSDIVDTTNDEYISYGAQFADHIRMGVRGVAAPPPLKAADAKECPGKQSSVAPLMYMR